MLQTRLVLFEGLPGSGKSSTAQWVERRLLDCGVPTHWWYEEEKDHPVYVFQDVASLQEQVRLLFGGEHRTAVSRALVKWRAFAEAAASTDRVLLVDSVLFGYVTWCLQYLDLPEDEVAAYLEEVSAILSPLNPGLVYLRQGDVRAAQAHICAARGEEWAAQAIRKVDGSDYAKRRGLSGFDGMVSFWETYRDLCDRLRDRLPMPSLVVDVTSGSWAERHAAVAELLGLPSPGDLARYAGRYGDGARIAVEDGELVAYDLPKLWHRVRLARRERATFEVESLPFGLTFESEPTGRVRRLVLSGRELMWHAVDGVYERRDP